MKLSETPEETKLRIKEAQSKIEPQILWSKLPEPTKWSMETAAESEATKRNWKGIKA